MTRKRRGTREQEAARSRLYLALWKPEDRGPGDGAFDLIFSTLNRLFFLYSLSLSPKPQAAGTVFFSSFSLSPFFIFKENICLAEGAQLRRSLAAQRAQQGAARLLNPFLGRLEGR